MEVVAVRGRSFDSFWRVATVTIARGITFSRTLRERHPDLAMDHPAKASSGDTMAKGVGGKIDAKSP